MTTVQGWLEAWADLPGKSEGSARHAAGMVAGFAAEHGSLALADVEPLVVARWVAARPGTGRYLRTFFNDAVRMGELATSPAAGVRLAEQVPRHATLDLPTLAQVLEAGRDPKIGAAVLVAAFTGLRFSELAGLRAQDVQDVPLRVAVTGKRTKANPSGRRTVAVLGAGGPALRRCMPAVGLVFPRPSGGVFTRQAWRNRWAPVWERVGMPGCWHSLRNFHGTWLLDQGASELDVAVQLGHMDKWGRPDPREVRRVYGRPDPVAALARLEAIA